MMMMNRTKDILEKLDKLIPNPRCELEYTKPYELLIATVLSAQCTDARVNQVTKVLWQKYSLQTLSCASLQEIESVIYPVGTYHNKAYYIKEIATRLLEDYKGVVPNDFNYLLTLPGVGRKTANVVLSNIFAVPSIAVDTHVYRTSHRLGLVKSSADVYQTEQELMKKVPKEKWSRLHHQLVLFGRYTCKSVNPICDNCNLKAYCKDYKKQQEKKSKTKKISK